MAIDRMKLFETARDRWPSNFAPSDRVVLYEQIEADCAPKGEYTRADEWTQLANWAFNQAVDTIAAEGSGERLIARDEVTFDRFDECLWSNLAHETWAEERREYEDSPLRASNDQMRPYPSVRFPPN